MPFLPSLLATCTVERSAIDPALHRLQWNESPFPFPADLKEEVLARLQAAEWERYPVSLRPFRLIDALAKHLGVEPERLVVSGGSSDIIRLIMAALLRPGDAVVQPSPTFLVYTGQANVNGARLVNVPLSPDNDWALPVDDLLAAAQREAAQVIALCAPNNPTGTVHPVESLATLAAGAADLGALLLVDEAYLHFNPLDLLPLALAHPNVILIRTLSKAYSMAGVRVGYAVAAPDAAGHLQKMVTSFPIGLFGEIVGEVVLEHHARFMQQVAAVAAERERLAAALARLPGLRVFSSGTNFLLVQPQAPARPIYEHLLHAHRVLISDCRGYAELNNHLRISIGTPAQNNLVIQGFREALGDG